ncbi:conserved hypothetical protein [metagenome]|uniref:Uncharacterized protein n=1 Tax=metagenome TaxID=256318 RepID=A0A2P2CB70_9ZZZZ
MGEPAVVRMANDIARQFAHLAPEDAAVAVAGHLRLFWDPRMRRELRAEVERDPDQVSPAVVTAMAASVVEPVETT